MILRAFFRAAAFLCPAGGLLAAPLAVPNFSFESPVVATTGTTSTNTLSSWTGTGGTTNIGASISYVDGFFSDTPDTGNNRQHLSMALGYDVWQNLSVSTTYTANTVYTFTPAVGNRGGATVAGNASTYSLAAFDGQVLKTGVVDASTIPVNTFADAPALVVDTTEDPGSVGTRIRLLLQARGTGRSYWDNARLDASPSVPNGRPIGTLAAASAITTFTATLNGTVTDIGTAAPAVTFYYGTQEGGANPASWANSVTVPGTQAGAFSANISGLTAATLYRFRARLENASGFTWAAPTRTFTTSPGVATVANRPATNLSGTAATLGALVSNSGGAVPAVTIYYGLTDGGATAAAWSGSVALGSFTGAGSAGVTGLTPGSTYFFRAAAQNTVGLAWAAASGTFSTLAVTAPVVVTQPASGLTPTSSTLNAAVTSVGNDPPAVTFYYGLVDGGADAGAWTSNVAAGVSGGESSVNVTGLTAGAEYFFRAKAVNGAGTAWAAETLRFTAAAVSPPVVVTRPADNITHTMATLRGEITDTGYETPVTKFYWGAGNGGTDAASWANVALTGADDGTFSRVLTGLTPGTVYYFRAFAENTAGGVWSPSGQSFTTPLTAAPSSVIINEVFYDPPDKTKFQEFIELYNPTNAPVNLAGWTIRDGVDYTFGAVTIPAGGYFCVVQNTAAFAARWPAVTAMAGPWNGKLNNDGEVIQLRNAAGGVMDEVDYRAGFPWPTSARGPGSSMQLLHPELDNGLGGSWRAPGTLNLTTGTVSGTSTTPGAANSGLLATSSLAPPAVRGVGHSPAEPTEGVPVTVTATVTDPDGVQTVELRYQIVNPGGYIRKTDAAFNNVANWIAVAMKDDGTGGDAAAGDSVFSVTIPAEVQTHRRLVRYQITSTDTGANAVRAPHLDDECPNFAYFVYNGLPGWRGAMRPTAFSGFPVTPYVDFPKSVLESLRPWHLIANETDVTNCQYNSGSDGVDFRGTLVHNGRVYDHITYKNRGIGSTYVSGKNKWAMNFNRARDFQPIDNWGRPTLETWNSVALNACAAPWASVHRGSAGVEESSSFRAFEIAGVPALRTGYVHWRVIRRASEAGTAGVNVSDAFVGGTTNGQYSGDLMGLYLSLEPTEGNFLDERGLDDGNVYSIEGNGGVKKNQGDTQPTTTADWSAFSNGLAQANQTEAWYRANMDLPALYSFLAVGRLVGNVDVRPGDNYRFYHRPSDNRWVILPYDLDMMYIAAHHWGGTMDGIAVAGAPNAIMAIMRHPALAREFRNRCREIMSLLASDAAAGGGQIGQLIDEYAQLVNPAGQPLTWADLDAHMWNLHPRSTGGGGNTGQSSHKGNFFRAAYLDGGRGGLGGTGSTGTWRRDLPVVTTGFSDHENMMKWFVNFATNTYPANAAVWSRKAVGAIGSGTDNDVNRQKGYGYKYLEWESLYGGYANAAANPAVTLADTSYPFTPVILYSGMAGYPANELRFTCTDFADPQGAGDAAAVQWRIGEISGPGIPGHDPSLPRIYEIEDLWTSPEIPLAGPAASEVKVPGAAVRPGRTYRARVRHKDLAGGWSMWSAPVQFIVGTPDVAYYSDALRVSQINYNPAAATAAEKANAAWDPLWDEQQFEYLELMNVGTETVDLTGLRFTKGVDYDFPDGLTIAVGARLVVAKNPAAFAIRYPGVTVAPGNFEADSLSNSGEELKLSYGAGTPVIEFTYDDNEPWPFEADGDGPAMVLVQPEKPGLDHGDPYEWRTSSAIPGTPGADDRVTWADWTEENPQAASATADLDNDGLNNLLEFALGSPPSTPSPEAEPVAGYEEGVLTFTFTHPRNLKGTRYVVEWSDGLTAWTENGSLLHQFVNGDGTLTESWRAPANPGPRLYARLRVTVE